MPRGSCRTQPEKEKSSKPAEQKPTPLKMDRVVRSVLFIEGGLNTNCTV